MIFASLLLSLALPASAAQFEAGVPPTPAARPAPAAFLTPFAGVSGSLIQPGSFEKIVSIDPQVGALAALDLSRTSTREALAPLAARLDKIEPRQRAVLLARMTHFASLSPA